ncbi:MAG: hypothetical protein IPG07_10445 [Crocinitomicaceae bacterium]|nr:hypothetical protein [Crocinitomicaceae bacterium]
MATLYNCSWIPIVVHSIFMATIFSQISAHNPPDPIKLFSIMPWMFVFYLISMLVLLDGSMQLL